MTKPIRTANDPEWTQNCDDLGNGTTIPVEPDEDGNWTSVGSSTWVDLPPEVKCYAAETNLNDARDWVHPNLLDFEMIIKSVVIAITNKQVDEHNNYFLSKVLGEERIMIAHDTIQSDLPTDLKCITADFTEALTHNKIPPQKLLIKVNGIYSIMRTINKARKLIHGTEVRVLSISNRLITVLNYKTLEEDDIPRINFTHTITPNSPIKILRRQFPLRPRYAVTSNAVQGKTIQRVLLDLCQDPFAHGQLHVSCTRVPTASAIRALCHKERIINGRARTINVVHKILLEEHISIK